MDEILNALAAEAGNLSVEVATSLRNESENSLFSVQLGFINADKEMKRIFGVRGWPFYSPRPHAIIHPR